MNGLIGSRFFCSVEKSTKKKDEFLEKIPGQEMENILFCVCVVRLGNFLRFLKGPTNWVRNENWEKQIIFLHNWHLISHKI